MNKLHLLKIKPQYAKLWFVCFLTVLSSQAVYAYDLEVDGIYYNISDDGTSVTVTSGDKRYSGDVVIPSTIKVGSSRTLDVTAIGEYAFRNCYSLTSISLPESVTSIGEYAFRSCSSLTSISLPESVTSIGDGVFIICSSLTSISIPEGVTSIGEYAFDGCSSLASISIPEGVTSIGDYAFRDCSSLTSISIPESVTSIGKSVFDGCSSLTSISIPGSVTSIENSAFADCSSLTSISIPESVTSIGYYAFRGCSSLTSISIPKGVTSIAGYAFWSCSSLISVVCNAENVPSIDSNTFLNTQLLSVLYVPASAVEAYKAKNYWKDIKNIFAIEEATTLSVGETGLASYCPFVNIDLNEAKDIAAYRATVEDNTVVLTRAYQVRVGEGVLLRSLNGGEATETVEIAEGIIIENEPNDFVGVVTDKWLMETDDKGNTNFLLSRQEDGIVGFYKAKDLTKLVAGKAYLPVPNYNPSEASVKGLRLVFDDDNATGIDIAEAKQAEADGACYTLSGVKVETPTAKGIYIKNGKKYIIK